MLHSNERITKHNMVLLNLAEDPGNVSSDCQVMGCHTTFYRYKPAVEEGGVETLYGKSRPRTSLRNRTDGAAQVSVV